MAPLPSLPPHPSSPSPPRLGRSAPRPSPVTGVRSPSPSGVAPPPLYSPVSSQVDLSPSLSSLPVLGSRFWALLSDEEDSRSLPSSPGGAVACAGEVAVACAAPRPRKFAPGGRGRPLGVSPSADGWFRVSRRRRRSGKFASTSPALGVLGRAPDGELGGSPSPSPSPAAGAPSPAVAAAGPLVAPCSLDPDLCVVAAGSRASSPCGPAGPVGAVLASGPSSPPDTDKTAHACAGCDPDQVTPGPRA